MSNSYYAPSGNPATLSRARSATQRAEQDLIEAGFDKLPDPHSNDPTTKGFGESIAVEGNVTATGNFVGVNLTLSGALAAALAAGGFKITGLGDGTAAQDAATMANLAAEILAGGSPGDVPITSLGVGTLVDEEIAHRDGAAIVGSGWKVSSAGVMTAAGNLNMGANSILNFAIALGLQLFTSSDTYTPTAGTTRALVIGQAAGGGGGGTTGTANARGGGGGAGETRIGLFDVSGAVTVTIGAAGSGGASGANNGTTASDSTFGGLMTCKGGTLGAGVSSSAGANGTTPTGSGGVRIEPLEGAANAGSVSPGGGGSCLFGTGKKNMLTASSQSNGFAGQGKGAGGGGGTQSSAGGSNTSGGDGAPGMFLVLELKQ